MDICEEFEDVEAAPPAAAPAAAPVAAPVAPTPTAPTASVENGAVVWAKMDGFPWWPAVVRRVDRAPPLIHVRFLQWEPPDSLGLAAMSAFALDVACSFMGRVEALVLDSPPISDSRS